MGYEVKMYIVESTPLNSLASIFVELGSGKWVHLFGYDKPDSQWLHYGEDGNTTTILSVVEKWSCKPVTKAWCRLIAMVDLCKAAIPSDNIKETDYYIYEEDGNTPIIQDKYGDMLKESSLEDVISYLQREIDKGNQYRRYKSALALALSCRGVYNNPIVLFYGH